MELTQTNTFVYSATLFLIVCIGMSWMTTPNAVGWWIVIVYAALIADNPEDIQDALDIALNMHEE